ncbi:MAG: PAS domain S-box protein [Alphaproteobacteria bacterium]|nr:PAS domain S-box protein [Alphaproteobacteria bacterium]MBU1513164.1 PAS domain S-box protein [Alphaproteobacteria bacterium]MBU2095272.1 PAS domain S-box protein [Alphaproteobacteria bacterium]MBU2152187.1 PAS domain S-box protein [Alphaproteobacteria bacterium]MBU2306766.1 PAS domain S-box protein [Alphaproteobacteria bacterium]
MTITASPASLEAAQNRQMAELLDSIGDGFMAFDFDWRVTYCNRTAEAHYQLRRQDAIGRVAWDLVELGDDSDMRAFLERAMNGRTEVEAEAQSELRPGVWFHLRAFPLEAGLGVTFRDVTERRERVRLEREQAARLELALATSGFGDWRWDMATDLADMSPRAAEMVGLLDGPTMTWTQMLEHVHPEDRELAQLAVGQALQDRTAYEVEYRIVRPTDQVERWIRIRGRVLTDDQDQAVGMLGVLADITEAKLEDARIRADRARLAESEARFRAMADSAPSPIWVTDANGSLEFANRAFRDMAGLPLEELTGDAWGRLLHPDDRAHVAQARALARSDLRPNSWEARFRVDDEWRWMRTASRARFDEAGVFQGYVGLAMDVTDTRLAEDRQRLLINELNHRVKNTLATIQSLARQTLRAGVSVMDARERLTERLLALSAAHNVLTRENWESADIADIAREAVRPYDDPPGARIAIDGPRARLAPNVALAISMALHELATNA